MQFSRVLFSAVVFFSESSSEPVSEQIANGCLMQKKDHTAGTAHLPKCMILLDAQSSKECVFSLVVTVNFNHLKRSERNIIFLTTCSVIIDSKIKYVSRACILIVCNING